MPKPHPIELRQRVVSHVEKGHSHRSTATRFEVSIKFVNDMVKLKCETGALLPKPPKGNTDKGKLARYKNWIIERVKERGDITLNELRLEFYNRFHLQVNISPLFYLLRRNGYSHKKRQFLHVSNKGLT